LASLLEIIERNARLRDRLAVFEIGPVFLAVEDEPLPRESSRLGIVMSGRRVAASWQGGEAPAIDVYDLKGVIEGLLQALHVPGTQFESGEHPSFHPGKCARVVVAGQMLGILGELHPSLRQRYELPETAVVAADLDMDALLGLTPPRHSVIPTPSFPPVLEDLAIVVDASVPAASVEEVIRQAGGGLLAEARLFDLYRGEAIGAGKKSLAYGLTYQAADRTLTDTEVAALRKTIVRALAERLGAQLRT
jgi:phenylalanyl-tRNA synthetase beta chain